MKKIIVTGGLGFIGSNLIDLLIKKNYFVINVDKVTYSSNFYNIKENKNSNKYKFIKCNIGEKKFRTEIVAREMQMLSSKGEMGQQNQDSGLDQSPQNSQEESVPSWDDEDIPF